MLAGEALDVGQAASAANIVPEAAGAASLFSPIVAAAGIGLSLVGNIFGNKAQNKQIDANIKSLRSELAWNTKVMQQNMVDTMASNKMSFWGSGLQIGTGTAAKVIENNQKVLGNELQHYQSSVKQQISNLASQRKSGLGMLF